MTKPFQFHRRNTLANLGEIQKKRRKVVRLFEKYHLDVLCIQEARLPRNCIEAFRKAVEAEGVETPRPSPSPSRTAPRGRKRGSDAANRSMLQGRRAY